MQLSVPVSFSLCCASSFSCASSQVLAMSSVTMPSRERWGQRLTIMIQTRFCTVSISTNLFQTKLRHILIKEITNLGRPSFHGVSLGHPHPQDSELKINKIFKIKINTQRKSMQNCKLLMRKNFHAWNVTLMNISFAIIIYQLNSPFPAKENWHWPVFPSWCWQRRTQH